MRYFKPIYCTSQLVCLLIFISSFTATAQPEFKKISKEEVGNDLIEKGNIFLDYYFAQMKSGGAVDFNEIGTKEIITAITPSIQKQVYGQVQELAGEYESASFKEAWVTESSPGMKILRYMGNFSKETPLELRVVYNNVEKIAGYIVIPWKDQLQ